MTREAECRFVNDRLEFQRAQWKGWGGWRGGR